MKVCKSCGAGAGGGCKSCGAPLGHAWLPEKAVAALEKQAEMLADKLGKRFCDLDKRSVWYDEDDHRLAYTPDGSLRSEYADIIDGIRKIGNILGATGGGG